MSWRKSFRATKLQNKWYRGLILLKGRPLYISYFILNFKHFLYISPFIFSYKAFLYVEKKLHNLARLFNELHFGRYYNLDSYTD